MSQSYGNPPPAGQSSGGGGMSVLMIVLIVLAVLGLICVGLCGACVYAGSQAINEGINVGVTAMIKPEAELAIERDETIKAKLGEPLTFGAETKNENVNLGGNSASFDFDVSGPNGKGTVHVEGTTAGGMWKANTIQVKFDDGSTVNVTPVANTDTEMTFPDFNEEGTIKMEDDTTTTEPETVTPTDSTE